MEHGVAILQDSDVPFVWLEKGVALLGDEYINFVWKIHIFQI